MGVQVFVPNPNTYIMKFLGLFTAAYAGLMVVRSGCASRDPAPAAPMKEAAPPCDSCSGCPQKEERKLINSGRFDVKCPGVIRKGSPLANIKCSVSCIGDGQKVACSRLIDDGFSFVSDMDSSVYSVTDQLTGDAVNWEMK